MMPHYTITRGSSGFQLHFTDEGARIEQHNFSNANDMIVFLAQHVGLSRSDMCGLYKDLRSIYKQWPI